MAGKRKFIKRALDLASNSEHSNFKHGAVVVCGGKILSEGRNTYLSRRATQRDASYSTHAEENALRNLMFRKPLKPGTVMYVARWATYGPAMSKPCARCEKSLKLAGIRRVGYSTAGGQVDFIQL